MSTIQIRIKDSTKKSAKKIFKKIGLDMSSAIKLYFHQVIIREGLPFQIVTENGLTFEEEEEIINTERAALKGKNVSRVMPSKEAIAYLKKL